MSIEQKVRTAIKCSGKTYQEIGDLKGVSKQAIDQKLSRQPSLKKLIDIVNTIGYKVAVVSPEKEVTVVGEKKEVKCMSIKDKTRIIVDCHNISTKELAELFNVTVGTMRNKLGHGLSLGELLKLFQKYGWSLELHGEHNVVIPITYEDFLEDKKKYDEGFHRKGYNAPYTPVDQR